MAALLTLPGTWVSLICVAGRRPMRRPGRTAAGQAVTEFLVLSAALIPLFLLIPLLAKYQDIRHQALLASRYAAFDATVRIDGAASSTPEPVLAHEIRRRYFTHPSVSIATAEAVIDATDSQHPLWRDPAGRALIANLDRDVTVRYGPDGRSAKQNDGYKSSADGDPFLLRAPFALAARGIYSARVEVALARLPESLQFYRPFDRLDLTLRGDSALLVDTWAANGPAQVEARLGRDPAVYPTTALRDIGSAADIAVTGIEAFRLRTGPLLGKLDFWRDVVPQDRLEKAAGKE